MGIPIFLFNWYSSFTGTAIHDSMFIFLYQFLFITINILFLGIYDKPYSKVIIEKFPALYLDGIERKKKLFAKFLINGVLEAIFQSILIYYISIFQKHLIFIILICFIFKQYTLSPDLLIQIQEKILILE